MCNLHVIGVWLCLSLKLISNSVWTYLEIPAAPDHDFFCHASYAVWTYLEILVAWFLPCT